MFYPLSNVGNHTASGSPSATHTRLTPVSGNLASGVAAVKFDFTGQDNNWSCYREFIALGQAASLTTPITWTGNSGSGGNASWISGADSNWTPGHFDPTSPLNFTATGINRNISVPAALAPFSITFANTAGTPYVFSGAMISVSNGITSATATGAVTFNGPVSTTTGVVLSGAGSLTFNGDLESPGLFLSGAGSISLNADNQDSGTSLFTGTASVSNGTLNIGNDLALSAASLAMTGGTANFTTAAPSVIGLSGTAGTVHLGNTGLTVGMDSIAGQADTFAGNISQAAGSGGLSKDGVSSLTLSGLDTYTGVTHVVDGTLQLAQRQSLYGGNSGAWTSSNIVVDSDATFGLNVGGAGEFTESDLNGLNLGGFAYGATLGITTTGIPTATSTLSRSISEPVNLLKQGLALLKITGSSTSLDTRMTAGTIQAANSGGISLPGDVYMGSAVSSGDFVYLSMGADNQFGADSVLHLANLTFNNSNAWVQLRGTSQTIAGLEGSTAAAFSIIQNDYSAAPDYVANPALARATLTINTPEFSTHSFYGLIRDGVSGAPVSIIKNGLGTQEFYNNQATGLSYSGTTTVNEGTLRLRFNGGGSSFGSDITVNSAGTLAFLSNNGNPTFSHLISGAGKVLVQGGNFTILNNGSNSWSGGTTVDGGRLSLVGVNATGAGTGPGQTCVAGAMDPSNVINLINGAVMPIDYYAALGQSSVLPQYAPSIYVGAGTQLSGGSNTVAFVSNITLDGGWISLASGNTTGGFNTNLAFVGTLVVGGVSSVPSLISTGGTGANANASLGSLGLPGTIFQVADVTNDSNVDLTVGSILRDISTVASPLTKTGPGTMLLSGANTYTGDTTVAEGTLRVSGNSIADTNKLVISGGIVDVVTGANEVVNTLYFGSTQQVAGTYGSSSSAATYQDDSRFSGTGIVTVALGPVTDPYTLWSAVIPNPADRAPTADPDHDGFTNLQEYLFGTSPIANNGSLTTFESTPGGLLIRWAQRASGTYILQESATLADPWTTSTAVISDATDQTGLYSADYTRKEALIPIDSPRKFVRVFASE